MTHGDARSPLKTGAILFFLMYSLSKVFVVHVFVAQMFPSSLAALTQS